MKRKITEIGKDDAFLREIREDIKNENLKQLWDRYGVYIIAAVAFILTITVSFETLKAWKHKSDQQWSNNFAYAVSLQNQGLYDKSLNVLDGIIENDHDIYADVAKLQVVNVLFDQEKTNEAIAELETLIKDNSLNKKMHDVALIKLASYKVDTASKTDLGELLNPLIQEDGSWAAIAKEMMAMVAVRDGNLAEANEIYTEILTMPNLDEGTVLRIKDMLSIINTDK